MKRVTIIVLAATLQTGCASTQVASVHSAASYGVVPGVVFHLEFILLCFMMPVAKGVGIFWARDVALLLPILRMHDVPMSSRVEGFPNPFQKTRVLERSLFLIH